MLAAPRFGALVLVCAAFLAPKPSLAQAAENRLLVYVDDVVTDDPKLKSEVGALTSALCGAIAKDKHLDVLCAPDVKQILGFAAASSMIGTASPAIENIQRRLEAVKFVVSGSLQVRENKKATAAETEVVLTVQAGPTAEGADPTSLYSDKPWVKIEEVTAAKQMKFLDKLPIVAGRVTRALLSPPSASTQPPPPLK